MCQIKPNAIKNQEISYKFWRDDSRCLGVYPRDKVLGLDKPYSKTPF